MPPTTTKERILEAAEGIMLSKSFHSVGLNEVLQAVQVPKGSFYHYFESKEQFGAELLRHYVDEHSARLRGVLLAPEPPPMARLAAFFNGAVSRLEAGECRQFCLVAKLGSEVSTFSEPMRAVLAEGIREWASVYETVIRAGQANGCVRRDVDASLAATTLLDLWQGAMHRTQIVRNVAPVRAAAAFVHAWLAAPPSHA